jgi:hypothetical protein
MQREYYFKITINNKIFKKLVIDDHYEKKHKAVVNDELIIHLVKKYLDGNIFEPSSIDGEGYEYFVSEPVFFEDRPFRLVWLLHQKFAYVGVINCFRRSHGKKK